MSDITDIALPQPARVGQGTAIEQSRAVAEVYAAIMVARQVPRSTTRALKSMQEACEQIELASKAFFAFPRGGKTVKGATIHLARELARCWGNIQYGIAELRRDDEFGQSEMLAFAWDLESNARASTIFIVPHKRDKGDQGADSVRLVAMRDIYENNTNAGARRVREQIFAVLPIWFREKAEAICRDTAASGAGGKGKPHAERVSNILKWLETVNVTEQDAVRKLGRSPSEWTGPDMAELGVLLDSIRQGTVTRQEAFPVALVSTEEIARQAAPAPAREVPAETEQQPTRESDVDAWHTAGHPGDTGARSSWDPECPACDPGGRFHYYDHAEPEDGCVWCQRDAAYRTEDGR